MAVTKIKALHCITRKPIELRVDRGRIVSLSGRADISPGDTYIGPGLTDIQVNGYDGVDFNTGTLALADAWHVATQLLAKGVTRFFPTVITNHPKETIRLLTQIHKVCLEDSALEKHIPGIHLEGPFISPEDGPRGAHDRRYVMAPDYPLFQEFQRAAGGKIKVITLSPHWQNAESFIRKCVKAGVIVSIGHTDATSAQIQKAVTRGATMATHLGNGAASMLPRHPNFIWDQLASDDITASVIADGHHLPPAFLKTALRTKGRRIILISDATMFAGMKPGVYDSHIGGTVLLSPTGRLCINSDQRLLAGAALPLTAGIDFLVNEELAALPLAWSMASIRVNKAVGLSGVTSHITDKSDLVIFSRKSGATKVERVFRAQKQIFPK